MMGKMSQFEKLFVNNDRHSQRVSLHAERLVRLTNPKPKQRYLDIGCGNGAAPIHIARKFWLEVTGVDVDPEQIALAQANSQGMTNIRFMTLDSRDLPFADGEFDIVFTNKVTHHITGWQKAVAEMVRVLRVGGYLIYADFILPSIAVRLGEAVFGGSASFPTREALDDLFVRSGLRPAHRLVFPMHFEGVFLKDSTE
jgi:ubiquinone/menaquinone biosynthesis C-methylase UbiE